MRILGMKPCFGEEEMVDPEKAEDKLDELRSRFFPKQVFAAGDFFPFMKWIDHWRIKSSSSEFFTKRDKYMQDIIDDLRFKRSSSSSSFNTNTTREVTKDEKESKRTIIEVLLSLQETEPECYTDDIIKGIILVVLNAGTETSTTTMEWAMSFLLNHPEVLNKARNEIDSIVGYDRLLNESDFGKLPYLHSIISETLRLRPIGPFIPPHESMEDCTIGGFDIPKGTMLLVNQLALHSDPNVWPEPMKFKPDRFEKGNGENGVNWIAFGLGRRACPGEGLALRMLGLTLGVLIQFFDWERIGGDMVDMSVREQGIRAKAKPLEAMYRPRKSLLHLLSHL